MDRKRPIRPVFIGPVRSFWVLEQGRTGPGLGPSILGQKTGPDRTYKHYGYESEDMYMGEDDMELEYTDKDGGEDEWYLG